MIEDGINKQAFFVPSKASGCNELTGVDICHCNFEYTYIPVAFFASLHTSLAFMLTYF
jgi:hypothetical protein